MSSTQDNQQDNVEHQLPNLRFRDGNVIIKLGMSSDDWLLLYKNMIEATMPTLGMALDQRWGREDEVINPLTGETTKVYTFALVHVDQTFVLEGKVVKIPAYPAFWGGKAFSSSVYGGGWPAVWEHWVELLLEAAVEAHRFLFAALYDLPIFLKSTREGQENDDQSVQDVDRDVDELITTCAYAEYYGCLDRIGERCLDLLLAHPGLWKAVAANPSRYLTLGRKLRSPEIYFDALRHFIAQNCSTDPDAEFADHDWQIMAEVFKVTSTVAKDLIQSRLREQRVTLERLKDDILRLQLICHELDHSNEPLLVAPTFSNSMSWKWRKRSDYVKARERFNYLARTTFGQWFIQKLVGAKVQRSYTGKVWGYEVSGFNYACLELQQAAESDNPAQIFGYKTPSRLRSIFRLGSLFDPAKYIRQDLIGLVKEAAGIINDAFKTRAVHHVGGVLTYRQARFDAQGDNFTYLPLEEHRLWAEMEFWEPVKPLPQVDMEAAPSQLVEAFGAVTETAIYTSDIVLSLDLITLFPDME